MLILQSLQFSLVFQLSTLLCPVPTVEPVSAVYLHPSIENRCAAANSSKLCGFSAPFGLSEIIVLDMNVKLNE